MNIKDLKQLVKLMIDNELNELEVVDGESKVHLKRGPNGVPVVSPAPQIVEAAQVKPGELKSASEPAGEKEELLEIRSPMVGTFYAAPDPESPPYVKVGDHVGAETTVCVIEAMKVFNQIPAEVSGKIVAVLVENGEPVEYGQPLFRVDTRG